MVYYFFINFASQNINIGIMITEILILIAGLALVVLGADWLVDGSSTIARKAGLSEFVIGLTIVGIGTSSPELVVSLTGALKGNADIAVGNIVGSNIFNALFILGFTALIRPIAMTRNNVKIDIPLNILVTVILIAFGMHHSLFGIGGQDTLSKTEGFVFLALFAAYMYWSFKSGKVDGEEQSAEPEKRKTWVAALMIVGGLAALIFGGDKFVDSATQIAKMLGISDKFIAVTILAGGTSLPELVTCVVAAAKKKGQLALGNILGSNISNILMILGVSAIAYKPLPGSPSGLSFSGMSFMDLGILLLGAVLIWVSAFTGKGRKLDRVEGFAFLATFSYYVTWLFKNM